MPYCQNYYFNVQNVYITICSLIHRQMPMPIMLPMPGMHPMAHPMPFHQGMHPQQQQQQSQHHGPEMAMIVEHRSAVPPVPLSAMVPPPQHPQMPMQHQQMQHQQMQQEQHHPEGRAFQPEGRSFQGIKTFLGSLLPLLLCRRVAGAQIKYKWDRSRNTLYRCANCLIN
jgi:hypothetical protein